MADLVKEAVVVLIAVVDLAVAFGFDKSEFSSGNLNLMAGRGYPS
jgi:hypothetical protein